MKKQLKKLLGYILTMSIILSDIPVIRAAAETVYTEIPVQTVSATEEIASSEEAYILYELVDKRDETTKYFAMSDGSTKACIYPQNIHYLKDGTYEEIDNTLVLQSVNEKSYYKNKNNSFSVSIPESFTDDYIEFSDENGYVRFRLEGSTNKKIEKLTKTKSNGNDKTVVQNVNDKAIFKSVKADVDIEYDLVGNKLKETIVLYKKTKNSFIFEVQTSVENVVKNNDGSVSFFDEQGKEIYQIASPYMMDEAGEYSNAIETSLIPTETGYRLIYTPDYEWLSAKERQYPVRIDPTLVQAIYKETVTDTYVSNFQSPSDVRGAWDVINIGRRTETANGSQHVMRGLIRFEIPSEIGENDTIVDAKLDLVHYTVSSAVSVTGLQVDVHELTESFAEGTTHWNNQPYFHPTIVDYTIVNRANAFPGSTLTYDQYNLTKLVAKWHNGAPNYGILLKIHDEATWVTSNQQVYYFAKQSKYYGSVSKFVEITYRNTIGLESYWNYSVQDFGQYGTGYVNNYNGNLVYAHEDLTRNSVVNAFTLSHVYNSCLSNQSHDVNGTSGFYGRGWGLSLAQKLEPVTISGNSSVKYKYTDGDGTEHYFVQLSDGKIVDEDGLGLTYKDEADDELVRQFVDSNGTSYQFDASGYLGRIKDSNGNVIDIGCASLTGSTERYFSWIYTSTSGSYSCSYDENHMLTKMIDYAGRETLLRYTSGNLTEVEYPDGTVLRYEYTTDSNKLNAIIAPDGKKLCYEYYPENGKVSAVKFYGKNNQLSSTLTFTYGQNQTKITDVEGRTLTYQFDTWGRPTCVYDNEQNIYAQTYTPTVSSGSGIYSNHKVASSSDGAVYVENLLVNSGLEDDWNMWSVYEQNTGAQVSIEPNAGLITPKAIKVTSETSTTVRLSKWVDTYSIPMPGTYTFSAYIKTENVVSENQGAALEVVLYQSLEEKHYHSEFLTGTTDIAIDNGYRKVSFTFSVEEGDLILDLMVGLHNASGTVYVDCVQLEEGDTANLINLVENSSMERNSGTGTIPSSFETLNTSSSPCAVSTQKRSGDYSFAITGHPSELRNVHQILEISGKKGDIHSFGAWAKADSVPTNGTKQMSLSFCYEYTDGSHDWFEYTYNPYVSDWQFGQKVAIARADYVSMGIYFCYYKNCNTAYCDNFFIYKDTSQSYRYDDKGNLVSTSDYADQQSQYSYNDTTLSKLINPTGTGYEYYYNSYKDLVTSKSSEGIITNITYDGLGNPISTSMYANEWAASIQPGKTYYIQAKSSGEYLTVENGGTGSGTNVIEMPYTGGSEQRWKLVAAPKGGLYLCPENAPGMALHVYSPSSAYEYNVQIEAIDDSDNQKFTIVPKDNFTYQILQTSSEDGKILTINRSKTQVNATVLPPQGDCNPDQCWRISEVEEGEPEAITDGVYQIRTRHTGKYLYLDGVYEGKNLVHNLYHEDSMAQDFWIERYNDTEYFTISPNGARSLYLTVSSVADGSGGTRMQLQYGPVTDAKLFKIQYHDTLNAWQMIPKSNENHCVEVSLTYTSPYYYGVSSTNTGGLNQGFILERLSDKIVSSATYDADGNYLESVTDSRGNTTHYTTDYETGLTTGVTDARGTVTNYTYNEDNDRLEEVQTGNSVVSYQYEVDGAIKNITTPSGTVYQFVYDDFGRTTQIKVGNQVLSETAYKNVYSSLVSRMTYGNDVYRTYEYDDLDRLISEGINESTTRTYLYDKQSNLVQVQDFLANVTTKFQYDLIGRTVGINMSDGQSLRMIYDNYNRVSLLKWSLGEESFSTGYIYGDNTVAGQKTSLLYGVTLNGEQKIGYTYDKLTRLESKTLATEVPFVTEYGYLEGSTAGTTTTLIKTVKHGNTTLEYAYDAVGNITSVKKNGVVVESYTYDALNQLTGATYGGNTYTYAYDNGGNITEVKKNGTVIKSYTYGNANWKDQLTAFNGETITYDKIGNPLTFRNNLSFTWQNGRQLSSIMQSGNLLATYTYNADGLRTSKTVGGVTTEYYWMNGTLYAQKTGEEYLYFLYDESGMAYGFVVKNNTENAYYYYEFNLQGDIIGIVNSAGTKVVEYTYGAWGDILSISGSMASTIGQKNPLRYRGYYYDGETGFYYLQSRYYDTEVCRFINADGYVTTGQDITGYNMYAYCGNNPLTRKDSTGQFWGTVAVIVVGGIILKNVYAATKNYKNNSKVDANSKTTTKNKIINDQNGTTGELFEYGRHKASWNACETIAVHNAKVLKKKESTLSETMLDFQMVGGMPLAGVFGSYPHAIGQVLRRNHMSYSMVNLDEMTKAGVYIISYWTEPNPLPTIHTVAIEYDGSVYITYNRYGNGNKNYDNPKTYASNFICGYYLGEVPE